MLVKDCLTGISTRTLLEAQRAFHQHNGTLSRRKCHKDGSLEFTRAHCTGRGYSIVHCRPHHRNMAILPVYLG